MINLFGTGMSKEEILKRVGYISQMASIKSYTRNDGKADGVRELYVVTGSGLDFTVLAGKCLDILDFRYRGINLGFIAKPGLTAPSYYESQETGFARSFQAGMLYTCGLLNVEPSCTEEGNILPIHGRIAQTPAEGVCAIAGWEGDDYILRVSGEVEGGCSLW